MIPKKYCSSAARHTVCPSVSSYVLSFPEGGRRWCNLCVGYCMLMNSVLHNFSPRSDSVGRLAAMMASVYDFSWKMTRIARL